MDNYHPKEIKNHPGYFEIPGFSMYGISKEGSVIKKDGSGELKPLIKTENGESGYYHYSMFSDSGKKTLQGRHRLLCIVFKHPGSDLNKLVVNHIDGIKGNDELDNLEWTTHTGNIHHAGNLGLTNKCLPISVRNVDSGVVEEFPSIAECAKVYGISKDAVNYRVHQGESRVFPDRKQYRFRSNKPWPVPIDIEKELMKNGLNKPVLLKNLKTNDVFFIPTLKETAEHLGLSIATLSTWINEPNQPVFFPLIQLQWALDPVQWREVKDPYKELASSGLYRVVQVVNENTGERKIYTSAIECSRSHGLSPTALNYRLSSNGKKVFRDGCRYGYYPF